jgi:anti-sigma regulatory factor (Ser/Thr protein kinase)
MQAARAEFVRILRCAAGPQADVEAAALAFGELVANAMRHGPRGEVRVSLRWDGNKATLLVSDSGAGFELNLRLPDNGQVGGRGLYIVNQLAGPVRVERTGGGCLVSVELPLMAKAR